jgi:hypothetical protein
MRRTYIVASAAVWMMSMGLTVRALAQSSSQTVAPSPPLFFQTEWKQPKTQRLVVSEDLTNANLEQHQYGPDMKIQDVKIEHGIVLDTKDNPVHIWTGLCLSRCLLTFRDKTNNVDLSDPAARIKWRTWQYGFNQLRPVIKLASGMWLVGDFADGYTADYHDSEFYIRDIKWRELDINIIATKDGKTWVNNPDLRNVEEIGFTDLMAGTGHGTGGSSHVSMVSVYGKSVKREPQKTN